MRVVPAGAGARRRRARSVRGHQLTARKHFRQEQRLESVATLAGVATTDATGHCGIRGFLGDYEIQIKHGSAEVTQKAKLITNGTTVNVVLP